MANRFRRTAPLRLLPEVSDAAPRTPPVLDEPSLFYDPPYADPLHDAFAWHLVKYLARGSGLRHQVEGPRVGTLALGFDFVVERGGRRIGFMCSASPDGAEHDRRCDALRIGCGAVDVLYRLRTDDIEHHLNDVLLLVAKWDAALFSERGRINLHTLAHPAARAAQPHPTDTVVTVRYDATDTAPTDALRLQRLSRAHPEGWLPAYERAARQAGRRPPAKHRWARSA